MQTTLLIPTSLEIQYFYFLLILTGFFDLVALLNHAGESANEGHYTCAILLPGDAKCSPSSQWFLFDNHNVSFLEDSQVVTADAYVAIYKKSS
jgi:uncharacterized UBP type Zn finger protein